MELKMKRKIKDREENNLVTLLKAFQKYNKKLFCFYIEL